jgi:hypothetical protein
MGRRRGRPSPDGAGSPFVRPFDSRLTDAKSEASNLSVIRRGPPKALSATGHDGQTPLLAQSQRWQPASRRLSFRGVRTQSREPRGLHLARPTAVQRTSERLWTREMDAPKSMFCQQNSGGLLL